MILLNWIKRFHQGKDSKSAPKDLILTQDKLKR